MICRPGYESKVVISGAVGGEQVEVVPMVTSKFMGLSPIFLSSIVASRNEPKRKNSSTFPVAFYKIEVNYFNSVINFLTFHTYRILNFNNI